MITKKLHTSKPWNKYPCYCPVRIIYLAYNNKLRLNSDSLRTSSISSLDRFPLNGRFSVRRNRRIRRTLQFLRSNGLLASTPAQPLTTMTEARNSKSNSLLFLFYVNFTVNSKFSANQRSYLQCLSWLKHWTKRFCADFSRSVANRMQVIMNKIHQNTLINGVRLFFPWELDRLSFSRASGRDSKQNRIYLQRN